MITYIRAAQIIRPANTTAYAAGDLVANNATAGSVVPMSFDLSPLRGASSGKITAASLRKSAASVTNANFTLHFFGQLPVVTNGDNGALLVTAANIATYIGAISIDLEAAPVAIAGGPVIKLGTPAAGVLGFFSRPRILYGLIEALEAYTPASAETFDVGITVET